MNYSQGSLGRVFLLKFEDKDDLLAGLKQVASRENVRIGTILLLGGMRSAGVVTGPKESVIPPEPVWMSFNDSREVIGLGTLFWKEDEPVIHLHGAIGRGREATVGCIRRDSSVYLVVEAVIVEITGINARKVLDEKSGLALLELN
jgi:predicted DNA-binding protein with PD1-like motif